MAKDDAHPKKEESSQPSTGPMILDCVKGLAWPAVALTALIGFWTPLHQILKVVPDIIGRSDSITVGSVSFSISKALKRKVDEKLKDVLTELAPKDIQFIVGGRWNSETSTLYLYENDEWASDPPRAEQYQKFLRLGLFRELSAEELRTKGTSNPKPSRAFRPTPLFDKTKSFLANLLAEAVGELQSDGDKKKTE